MSRETYITRHAKHALQFKDWKNIWSWGSVPILLWNMSTASKTNKNKYLFLIHGVCLILKEKMETESRTPFIKSLLSIGCFSFPPPPTPTPKLNSMFGPHCQAESESRGVIKNLILVGTIIMLVALVRHMFLFHYLCSSSPLAHNGVALKIIFET